MTCDVNAPVLVQLAPDLPIEPLNRNVETHILQTLQPQRPYPNCADTRLKNEITIIPSPVVEL